MDAQAPNNFSPEVVKLLQTVPAAEVEAVLKQAFPQFFDPKVDRIDQVKIKALLEKIRSRPKPRPKESIVDQIRRLREQDHTDYGD